MTESRQTEMKDYPGHAALGRILDGESPSKPNLPIIWQETESLLRQYQKLREAVCVLEDGAEPEVGDVVKLEISGYTENLLGGKDPATLVCYQTFPITRSDIVNGEEKYSILKRNGRPCVYRSALKETA